MVRRADRYGREAYGPVEQDHDEGGQGSWSRRAGPMTRGRADGPVEPDPDEGGRADVRSSGTMTRPGLPALPQARRRCHLVPGWGPDSTAGTGPAIPAAWKTAAVPRCLTRSRIRRMVVRRPCLARRTPRCSVTATATTVLRPGHATFSSTRPSRTENQVRPSLAAPRSECRPKRRPTRGGLRHRLAKPHLPGSACSAVLPPAPLQRASQRPDVQHRRRIDTRPAGWTTTLRTASPSALASSRSDSAIASCRARADAAPPTRASADSPRPVRSISPLPHWRDQSAIRAAERQRDNAAAASATARSTRRRSASAAARRGTTL